MASQISDRERSYTDWYLDIVLKAQLADYSPVRGCMVIRPRGYALWEKMQSILDGMLKATGHQNAYFPMLIPEKFIHKESEHVEGFSPELAVVTQGGGEQLEEALILRPTSETIIWSMYKQWIQSYRDLPLLINQWANVVRWEKRTRLFLRTTEFLWQEGHTAHETREEAVEETEKIFRLYQSFARDYMAMHVIGGRKTESEKFAGAEHTLSIESMMQDGKSLQAGTSHFLGQKFAVAFDVQFQTREGTLDKVWATSWGVSTRLIGALIMAHSDNKGLIIPPKLASTPVIVIPIFKNDTKSMVLSHAQKIADSLPVHAEIDRDDQKSPGWKFSEWEMRGTPLRVELGPRDIERSSVVVVRRDTGEKIPIAIRDLTTRIPILLDEIQKDLLHTHTEFTEANTLVHTSYDRFRNQEGEKFTVAGWNGDPAVEQKIKNDTKATIRVILDPAQYSPKDFTCLVTGEPAQHVVLLGKAY